MTYSHPFVLIVAVSLIVGLTVSKPHVYDQNEVRQSMLDGSE